MHTTALALVGSALVLSACGADSKARQVVPAEAGTETGGAGGVSSSSGGKAGNTGGKTGNTGGTAGNTGGAASTSGGTTSAGGAASAGGSGGATAVADGGPLDAGSGGSSPAADVLTVPCSAPSTTVSGVTGVLQVMISGTRLVHALNGSIIASNLDGTAQTTLIPPATDEFFNRFTIANGIVYASGSQNIGGPRRVARAPVDGTSAATFYDLTTYTAYKTALNLGVNAFVPQADSIVSNGTTVFVQDVVHGGLLALNATTLVPVGFLLGTATDPAVYGASHFALQGTRLVAMMDRAGINVIVPVHAVRTFDVSTPSAMTQTAQTPRASNNSFGFVYDPTYSRYLYSTNNPSSQIWSFTVDGAGTPSQEKLVYGVTDRQIRDLAVIGGVVVAGAPRFVATADSNLLLLKNADAALTLCCTSPLATQQYANSIAASATTAFVGGGSPTTDLASVSLAPCQ